MDFDKVLEEIGDFGRYQKRNYLLICLPVMFAAANSLSYVFTAGIPVYRCTVTECENDTNAIYNANWIRNALPGTVDKNGIFTPEQCLRYQLNTDVNQSAQCPIEMFNNRQIPCDQWVFDGNEKTIVNEWLITCTENAWKLAMVGTMHFAGLVVGTSTSGFLADRFGRKLIFVISIIFMSITGVLQGIAWDYYSFLTFALLNAVGTAGVYPLAFIIGVEMVGPRKREMSSIVLNYFYAVGEALVGLLAWMCKDWQLLQFVLSAPPLVFALYYWFVPESVRWLIAKNENKKAGKIIKKAARVNRKELSQALLSSFTSSNHNPNPNQNYSIEEPSQKVISITLKNSEIEKSTPTDLTVVKAGKRNESFKTFVAVLKSKILVIRFTVLLYIWAVNAFVFYGLSLNSTNLSGNKYINFSLVCLIEIPGYSLAWIFLRKFGRRWALSGSLLLCAVTCAAGGFVDQGFTWAIVTLFLLGKLGITSSFAVIYAYTAEMMPTIIRSGGVGCMSTVARFGAMVAPFVPLLGIYYKPLPLLLFGGVSFTAGLLALALPETFRQKLPDTVEEAENIGETKIEQ